MSVIRFGHKSGNSLVFEGRMLRLVILACAILTLPPPRNASPALLASTTLQSKPAFDGETLSIGRVTLRLGMAEDAVLSDLGKYYFLQRYEPSTQAFDNWLILNKAKHEENLGALRFRSGKLTLARKEWTHEEKEYSGADRRIRVRCLDACTYSRPQLCGDVYALRSSFRRRRVHSRGKARWAQNWAQ